MKRFSLRTLLLLVTEAAVGCCLGQLSISAETMHWTVIAVQNRFTGERRIIPAKLTLDVYSNNFDEGDLTRIVRYEWDKLFCGIDCQNWAIVDWDERKSLSDSPAEWLWVRPDEVLDGSYGIRPFRCRGWDVIGVCNRDGTIADEWPVFPEFEITQGEK